MKSSPNVSTVEVIIFRLQTPAAAQEAALHRDGEIVWGRQLINLAVRQVELSSISKTVDIDGWLGAIKATYRTLERAISVRE